MRWARHAACIGQGDLFFPPCHEDSAHKDSRVARAKAICATCPVTKECFEDAWSRRERYGIWSGYTEEEREKMRRRRITVGQMSLVAV